MQRRRRAMGLAVALALAVVIPDVPAGPGPGPGAAHAQSSAEQELAEARAERDRLEAQLDVALGDKLVARDELLDARARLEQARRDLALVEGQLALAEEALVAAERRRDDAIANLETATWQLEEAEADLAVEQATFADQVAVTYKYGAAGRGQMVLTMLQHARTPNELVSGLYRLGAVIDHQDAVVDRISELRAERERLQDVADREREVAEAEKQDALETFEHVTWLKESATRLRDQVAAEEAAKDAVVREASGAADALAGRLEEARRRVRRAEEALRREQLASRGGVLCPIDPVWFTDDWGYPRSGGRRHKGNDLFAEEGTPIVAISDGVIRRLDRTDTYVPGSNRGDLGGISISYWVAEGEYWYWAHLQRLADGLEEGQSIRAGQLVGWVGRTGNAYNTPPHAHVGRYVNGAAVNPYPTLKPACG